MYVNILYSGLISYSGAQSNYFVDCLNSLAMNSRSLDDYLIQDIRGFKGKWELTGLPATIRNPDTTH